MSVAEDLLSTNTVGHCTAADLVDVLVRMGVQISLQSKSIRLRVPFGAVPNEAIELTRTNKPLLLEYLVPRCQHFPPFEGANEVPDRYGRPEFQRLECADCGRLIGYREIASKKS